MIIGVITLLSYVKFYLPNVGNPELIKLQSNSKMIERGRYLAMHVTVCIDCHSKRDWSKFSGPIVPGTEGQGGEVFDQKFGFPGKFIAKNITPYHLNQWTDGEILRAISSGVTKEGNAIFPVMPHKSYGKMDKQDLLSIIAFLRTLPSIKKDNPASEADFPMNFIVNTIPQKANYSKIPSKSNKYAYGAYLFNAASCGDCHTKQEKGAPIEGMELAGGFEFPLPSGGVVRSANITSDKTTGIGNWTEEAFVNRFKMHAEVGNQSVPVKKGEFNSVMPWEMYAGMTEEDLSAIFTYLKKTKAIKNEVIKFSK